MTHKEMIEYIRSVCTAAGGVVNVTHQSGHLHGTPGIPDLYLQFVDGGNVRYPVGFWCEVKVGKDTLSPDQQAFIARERRLGRACVVGGLLEVLAFVNPYLFRPIVVT